MTTTETNEVPKADPDQGPVVLMKIVNPAHAGLPEWCRGFDLRRETDGRLYAVGERDNCYIYVMARAWAGPETKKVKPQPADKAPNYGVVMSEMNGTPSAAGTLTTNDPDFKPMHQADGATVAGTCPAEPASPTSTATTYGLTAAVVALAGAIAVIATRRNRKARGA